MGVCGYSKNMNKPKKGKEGVKGIQICTGHKPIPLDIINKVKKSICKIKIENDGKNNYATGFFMTVSDTSKCLITNYHMISEIIKEIEVEIHNKKTSKIKLKNRVIKYYLLPIDITMIEIKNSDNIYNEIKFLDYDMNYKKGYYIYKDDDIFSIQYPLGKEVSCASGKIININKYEFYHDIPTEKGASGSPIILLNNNINSIQVLGIHKWGDNSKKLNIGTFIGEIFNEYNSSINYIIAEIKIKDDDINKKIRIINSYEEHKRNTHLEQDKFNGEEIKNNCKISINNELIPFNYFHEFQNAGIYTIKYSFKNYLTKANYMFCECKCFRSIDLSNFNTQNVTNMSYMFSHCESLNDINLSNFNTQNVTDMNNMFSFCKSLNTIDLSNFKTRQVIYMSNMFYFCESLENIDLSNFNTQNVIDMNHMFSYCISLDDINLSKLNTQNVINMNFMFAGCKYLTNIDLSSFNTQNVTDMKGMFTLCKSLKNLNLKNFNTQNVTDMSLMFSACESLTNLNLKNFDTQKVIDMNHMFFCCKSLTKIILSNFDIQNVTDISYMFSHCESLIYLNLSHFNTQNVRNMCNTFSNCKLLIDLKISNFNTQNVINMSNTFSNCKSLPKLKISDFDTQNVIDMNHMFSYCESLTEIDLYRFNFKKVIDMSNMFRKCISLQTIYVEKFKTNIHTKEKNIFSECMSLKNEPKYIDPYTPLLSSLLE